MTHFEVYILLSCGLAPESEAKRLNNPMKNEILSSSG
jgi:hypothetical protein